MAAAGGGPLTLLSALDYVLKPVHLERLAPAPGPVPADEPPHQRGHRAAAYAAEQVFIKDGEHCHFVRLAYIDLFEAVGNYVRVYFGPHAPLHHKSLQQLDDKLLPYLFFTSIASRLST